MLIDTVCYMLHVQQVSRVGRNGFFGESALVKNEVRKVYMHANCYCYTHSKVHCYHAYKSAELLSYCCCLLLEQYCLWLDCRAGHTVKLV
jgi:hypothetical protein